MIVWLAAASAHHCLALCRFVLTGCLHLTLRDTTRLRHRSVVVFLSLYSCCLRCGRCYCPFASWSVSQWSKLVLTGQKPFPWSATTNHSPKQRHHTGQLHCISKGEVCIFNSCFLFLYFIQSYCSPWLTRRPARIRLPHQSCVGEFGVLTLSHSSRRLSRFNHHLIDRIIHKACNLFRLFDFRLFRNGFDIGNGGGILCLR